MHNPTKLDPQVADAITTINTANLGVVGSMAQGFAAMSQVHSGALAAYNAVYAQQATNLIAQSSSVAGVLELLGRK